MALCKTAGFTYVHLQKLPQYWRCDRRFASWQNLV